MSRYVRLHRIATPVLLLWGALGGPGAAQTPPQTYDAWAPPPLPAAELRARRGAVLDAMTAHGLDLLLLPSADGSTDGETFRQLDDFWYLTGLETPRSLLVLDAAERRALLFLPRTDPRFENPGRPNDFPGRPLGDDPRVAARAGLEGGVDVDVLPDSLEAWVRRGRRLALHVGRPGALPVDTAPLFGSRGPLEQLVAHVRARYPAARLDNAWPALAAVRGIKRPLEIRTLQRAADVTAAAIRSTARSVRPGVDEATLQGRFEAACRAGGAQRIPFTPIVKSGPNSLWPWRILAAHYHRRNRTLRDGELVILDVGCEVDGYVSDVGRTFPVSGRFSPAQRRRIELVNRVSAAIIQRVRPGVTYDDLLRAAYDAIPDSEERYMQAPVFFGHHIGLSTSEPVDLSRGLQAGMVLTVEPWYYNHDEGVAVFVEDVVRVTEDGATVLTRDLARSPGELEALVRATGR